MGTKALRLLELIPEKFERLEFSDGTGKVADYEDLLLDYTTFSGIVLLNSKPYEDSVFPQQDSKKIRRPVDGLLDSSRVGRMKMKPPNAPLEKVRAAFDTFDPDSTGFIMGKDLTNALRLLGLKPD